MQITLSKVGSLLYKILFGNPFKRSPEKGQARVHRKDVNSRDGMLPSSTGYQDETQLSQFDKKNATPDTDREVNGHNSISKEEARAANIYRWKLMIGLFFPFSVQALDTTIIAGALPFIASDFSKE